MAAEKKLKGWHVLLILIGFFGVVFAVNAYFVAAALDTFPGEEVMHPYFKGVHYNAKLEERAKEKALGWSAEIASIKRDSAGLLFTVVYRDRDGKTLSNLKVVGALKRTTHAGDDQTLDFKLVGAAYMARAPKAGEGLWDLSAVATSPSGDRFEFEKRLTLE